MGPHPGSSGGLCRCPSAVSVGMDGSWEDTGSTESCVLTALESPGSVGLAFSCFLAVLLCFRAGGFFLAGKVCLVSAPGSVVGAGEIWLCARSDGPSTAGLGLSSAAGSRLRAVPCLGPPILASSAGSGRGLAGSSAASGRPSGRGAAGLPSSSRASRQSPRGPGIVRRRRRARRSLRAAAKRAEAKRAGPGRGRGLWLGLGLPPEPEPARGSG